MATPSPPVTMDTLIGVRVSIQGTTRKFRIPLGDLNAQVLPGKLRFLLNIPDGQMVTFERFSDSVAAYVTLDPSNQHVYKTLFRAAKAKLKLRLRAVVPEADEADVDTPLPPVDLPGSFDAALPTSAGFGSEVTLDNIAVNTSSRAQASAETLVPFSSANGISIPALVNNIRAEASSQARSPSVMGPAFSKDDLFQQLADVQFKRDLVVRTKEQPVAQLAAEPKKPSIPVACSWSVYCNVCDKPMSNDHYHCNICDDGDYDLCETCVNSGLHCGGDGHWLVRRFVKNGQVVSSTTETLAPRSVKPMKTEAVPTVMPGAFTEHSDEKSTVDVKEHIFDTTRTCNCCVIEYPEDRFVTCLNCEDYDICIQCHEANQHGHHPGHTFEPVSKKTKLSSLSEKLCASGRNTKHAAICDGCDKPIHGIRNKCLQCPDWDYCSQCYQNAAFIHPGHRFASLYDPLLAHYVRKARHVGIYCDGPLCEDKHDYIDGVRYKCAICHDTDFCANCEAHPHNKHNHTHPLIQFKTPVRNATITTVHEDQFGNSLANRGDRRAVKAESSKTQANVATEVQTIVEVKPAEASVKAVKERIEIKDLLAEPIQEKIKIQDLLSSPIAEQKKAKPVDVTRLNAVFVRETVVDGTFIGAGTSFTQTWTLRNPGPDAWPAGCSVRYTGGDNMLDGITSETNLVTRPVEVGEEIPFCVSLKVPEKSGEKISYWRLKTADGQAFGHRLWCHVRSISAASEPSVEPPSNILGFTSPPDASSGRPWQDKFLRQALEQRLQQRIQMRSRLDKERLDLESAKAEREKQAAAIVEAKAARDEMLRKLIPEMHAVETKQRARVAAARAAQDAARTAQETQAPEAIPQSAPPTTKETPALTVEDYQMQLMLLEQQNKKRIACAAARKGQDSMAHTIPPPPLPVTQASSTGMHALQDWQMQLMLLEQQNRQRLIRARLEQEAFNGGAQAPVEVEAEVKPIAVTKLQPAVEDKSSMIFPKLVKESPVSSTHDLVDSSTAIASEGVALASPKSELEHEIFDDAESVSLLDSSEDEGFLTDEEYDILDASDEEIAH